jgi:hypothetical protein
MLQKHEQVPSTIPNKYHSFHQLVTIVTETASASSKVYNNSLTQSLATKLKFGLDPFLAVADDQCIRIYDRKKQIRELSFKHFVKHMKFISSEELVVGGHNVFFVYNMRTKTSTHFPKTNDVTFIAHDVHLVNDGVVALLWELPGVGIHTQVIKWNLKTNDYTVTKLPNFTFNISKITDNFFVFAQDFELSICDVNSGYVGTLADSPYETTSHVEHVGGNKVLTCNGNELLLFDTSKGRITGTYYSKDKCRSVTRVNNSYHVMELETEVGDVKLRKYVLSDANGVGEFIPVEGIRNESLHALNRGIFVALNEQHESVCVNLNTKMVVARFKHDCLKGCVTYALL